MFILVVIMFIKVMRRVGNIYGSCKVKSKMPFIRAIYFSNVDANMVSDELAYNEKLKNNIPTKMRTTIEINFN